MLTPSEGWLESHLLQENAGQSIAACGICLLFVPFVPLGIPLTPPKCGSMVGSIFFGNVELLALLAVRVARALTPNLDPHGFEDYAVDEPTSDDDEDLFLSDSDLSNSVLTEGYPLCCVWTLGCGYQCRC